MTSSPERGSVPGKLPGAVLALGVVSLLTDLSSEMIYPLLPVFLTSVLGAGALSLGIIEGVAEATASLLKLVSGIWSDRLARRKSLVTLGYILAGAARPLIGLAASWPQVLGLRFTDRVGKGLRTSPRDALIADVTPPARRGAAFGLQRAMDHAGAVLGPLAAAALLTLPALSLRQVFLLAGVPAAAAVVVLLLAVREPRPPPQAPAALPRPPSAKLAALPVPFRRFLAALGLFTLGNSTDAFLLLRLAEGGLAASWVAVLWSAHHGVKMATAYAGGRLADRVGRRSLVLAAWGIYAAVYAAFALFQQQAALVAAFLIYGLSFGLAEPAERAWLVDLAPAAGRGRAFGAYHAVVGLAALPASLLFGLLWTRLGVPWAFATGASLALAAAALLLRVPEQGPASESTA